jgi:DNA-binding HxlR family transcriptional regulator
MSSNKQFSDGSSTELRDKYSKISEIVTLFSPNKVKILLFLPEKEKKAVRFKFIQKEAKIDQKNLRKILKVLMSAGLIAKSGRFDKAINEGAREKWIETHPHYYLTELGFAVKSSLIEIVQQFTQYNKDREEKYIDWIQFLPQVDSSDSELKRSIIVEEIQKIRQLYPLSEVYNIDEYETKHDSGEFQEDGSEKTSSYHIYFELKEKIIVIGVFPQEELEELYSFLRKKIPFLYEYSHIKARLLNPSSIFI